MRLKDVAKGSWAIKAVPLRLVNTTQASQPGQAPSAEPVTVMVGVRVLTGDETAQVYQKAQADAKAKDVPEWKDDHPLCRLYLMVHMLALACVDVDAPVETPVAFFEDGAVGILASRHVGTDNIAYLFERWQDWQDECSIEKKNMTAEEVVAAAFELVERPENAVDFLFRMRPGTRVSFTTSLAALLIHSLDPKSPSGSPGESSTDKLKSDIGKLDS